MAVMSTRTRLGEEKRRACVLLLCGVALWLVLLAGAQRAPRHPVVRRALATIDANVRAERTTGDVHYRTYGYNAQVVRRTGARRPLRRRPRRAPRTRPRLAPTSAPHTRPSACPTRTSSSSRGAPSTPAPTAPSATPPPATTSTADGSGISLVLGMSLSDTQPIGCHCLLCYLLVTMMIIPWRKRSGRTEKHVQGDVSTFFF